MLTLNDSLKDSFWKHCRKKRKCLYPEKKSIINWPQLISHSASALSYKYSKILLCINSFQNDKY